MRKVKVEVVTELRRTTAGKMITMQAIPKPELATNSPPDQQPNHPPTTLS